MIKFHQLVWGLALAATALSLAACDDTTDNIGGSLIDNPDKLTVKADTFQLSTRTIMADSVIARNITGYLGRVKDPETGNYVTGDFMAQLHPLSNYQIAAADSILIGLACAAAGRGQRGQLEPGMILKQGHKTLPHHARCANDTNFILFFHFQHLSFQ